MPDISNFVVLTASAGVSDEQVSTVLEALPEAVGEPRRLGPGAVDIAVSRAPGADLRTLGVGMEVDANVIPAENRQKKLLIADMDSTIIPVECIDELADFAGVKPEVSEITERAMRGELDFEQAIDARVALLKGLPETALQRCYDERVSLNPGARELIETMNRNGAFTALVSGGFTFFTSRVAAEAGFAINQANTLNTENGVLTGTVARPILGQQAKLEALQRFVAERGIGLDETIAVGDGANDLAMIRAAGLGVAFRAKPALKAEADALLDYSDLTAILALQGINTGS
jgi:phosphoserine phosphatase